MTNPYEKLKTFNPLPPVDSEWISIQILFINDWKLPPGIYHLAEELEKEMDAKDTVIVGLDENMENPNIHFWDYGFCQPVKFDISGS